jgi:NADPH-dependent glutamate synthase beta subunit-like oxidoreductase
MNSIFLSQQARAEAERCLQCYDAPCIQACPAHIKIPLFIGMIRNGNSAGAAEVVKTSNALINVCGKICPEETFCQSVCTRGKQDEPIKIRELHFFATQEEAKRGYTSTKPFPKLRNKIAVVGAGPSGLSCAFELSKFGYHVDVFEKRKPGGIPRASIPAFRLADKELESDIKFLSKYFTLKKKTVDGKTFAKIQKTYDASFLSIGLGKDRLVGIPGEKLQGVVPVIEFLETAKANPKKMKLGKHVVIIGGGNVSLDAAATAKRLGAESVILIYRRSEKEMRVWKAELEESRKQGVEIRFLINPIAVIGKKRIEGIKCRRTKLSKQKDASGRPRPVDVKGSDFILDADTCIVAIGQSIAANWLEGLDREKGYVKVDGNFRTSVVGVFAGGDMIAGEGTIVQSVAQGKHAAQAIHEFLSGKQEAARGI